MKKFVSILTVVAMVAALCTSAFAAVNDSEGDPYAPGAVVEYDPGDFNVPDPDATTPTAPAPVGGGETPSTPAAGGETPSAAGGETPSTPAAGETPAAGGSAGGAGQSAASGDASTQSPTAKLEDYEEASLAYIMVKMVNNSETPCTAEELIKAMGVEADFPFEECTIASNALATKNAKGVKKGDKLANGNTPYKVGQNQVTDKHDAEDLIVIVAPAKVGAKAEVCKITLDDLLNMDFESTIDDGAFTILLNTKKAE